MSTKYLGEQFDIHGGGMDLKFPHHECEIAQNHGSCNHGGAKFWMHANMLNFNGQKMSKSYHNVIPLFSDSDTLRRLIFKIKTDSKRPEEPKMWENCTLFDLYQAFSTPSETESIKERYQQGIGWAEMKEHTFKVVDIEIAHLRQNYQKWVSEPKKVDDILQEGEARAREEAEKFMKNIRRCVGFV